MSKQHPYDTGFSGGLQMLSGGPRYIPVSAARQDFGLSLFARLMGVYCLRIEQTQSRGRVDCILETPQYVYVFEFKPDGSADEALRQIEEKGYDKPYLTDKRKIVRIGVVFSSQTRTVPEWKER